MNSSKDSSIFGPTVLLENTDTGEEVTLQLAGSDKSDIKKGRISVRSPLGQVVIGKIIGD